MNLPRFYLITDIMITNISPPKERKKGNNPETPVAAPAPPRSEIKTFPEATLPTVVLALIHLREGSQLPTEHVVLQKQSIPRRRRPTAFNPYALISCRSYFTFPSPFSNWGEVLDSIRVGENLVHKYDPDLIECSMKLRWRYLIVPGRPSNQDISGIMSINVFLFTLYQSLLPTFYRTVLQE